MSGEPPRPAPPPMRGRLPSHREDPRREPGDAGRRPVDSDVVRLLANAEADRRIELDLLARIAAAVEASAAMQRLPPMRGEATSEHDVAMEALKLAAEATGRHHVTPVSVFPVFLRDWKGPLRLTRKVATWALAGACTLAGGMGLGWLLNECHHPVPTMAAHP